MCDNYACMADRVLELCAANFWFESSNHIAKIFLTFSINGFHTLDEILGGSELDWFTNIWILSTFLLTDYRAGNDLKQ